MALELEFQIWKKSEMVTADPPFRAHGMTLILNIYIFI